MLATSVSAISPDLKLAVRNIKLGNTYREGKDYDNAAKFLIEGLKVTQTYNDFDGNYWTAAAYEGLGYLYRDMSMFEESKANFKKALEIFQKIIKQEDGSQQAMISVLNKVVEINAGDMPQQRAIAGLSGNVASLADKKLKELPSDIPLNTKSIILKGNRFRQFPDGILKFKELEYLDLSSNRLRNISEGIGNLKDLHYLDLSSNKIDKLPTGIGNLQNLKELNLSGNKLKEINFNLCSLKNLRLLNLQKNKIEFQEVLKLVRCMPNTNILFDKYERQEEEIEGEELDYD